MYTLLKKLWILLIPFLMLSCMKEDEEDCAVFLEFIFDHNMDYTDLFEQEIEMVDVYVFDAEGYYLFAKQADCPTELIGGKRMKLEEGFSLGKYKIITVGALSHHFRFTDINNEPLKAGVTRIEEVQLSLYRETHNVEAELPHLWYGKPVEIEFRADLSVWRVDLIRQTNHFNILVEYNGKNLPQKATNEALYTFEIITPEGGVYDHDNNACFKEPVTYHPYTLSRGSGANILSEAKIRTMRLLSEDKEGYEFLVRDRITGEEILRYNLMGWLEARKPSHPDGSHLPFQEYLDREWEWDIVILMGDDGSGTGFVAVKIIVNGWIIWIRDIEI